MLEDQRSLDPTDLLARRESFERQLTQMFGVAGADVHQEIVFAGEVVEGQHLGAGEGVALEGVHFPARMARESHSDQSLQRDPDARRRDFGVATEQHAVALQAAHALQTGGFGQVHAARELLVADPSILLERGENRTVDSVERLGGGHHPYSIRWTECASVDYS